MIPCLHYPPVDSQPDYSFLAVVCCHSVCIVGSILSKIVGSFVPWNDTMPRDPHHLDTPGDC